MILYANFSAASRSPPTSLSATFTGYGTAEQPNALGGQVQNGAHPTQPWGRVLDILDVEKICRPVDDPGERGQLSADGWTSSARRPESRPGMDSAENPCWGVHRMAPSVR